jgi:hypothetical protein
LGSTIESLLGGLIADPLVAHQWVGSH